MASVLKLKTDIKKLKAAISSKATSGAIKTKLRGKLTSLENELDKLQPNKRKPKTTGPKNESALVRLAKKRRTNQGLSTSKSDIERDAIRPAKKAGKRTSASGNTYYEYRDNRVDNRQPPKKYRKLADGGMMADAKQSIKEFYVNTYPTDVLGQEINGKATFNGLNKVLDSKNDVYEYLGVGDSMIRERVFDKLSKISGDSYDVIYNKWLETDYADGGKTQGYDDKKDESLGMTRGKLSLKDFVGNRKQKEHSRRDDARFEERGKMDHGGYMADGGNLSDAKVIAKLKKKFANKNLDEDFDFDEDDNFKVDGYNVEIFDYKEEDEMNDYIKKHSKDNYLVPYSSDDDNYYLIVVPKDKMAHGGYMADGGQTFSEKELKAILDEKVLHHVYQALNGFDMVNAYFRKSGQGGLNFALYNKLTIGKLSEVAEKIEEYTSSKMADGGYMADGGSVDFDYELKIQPDYKYKNIANGWLEDNAKDSLKYKLAVLLLRGKKDPDEILDIKESARYARLLRSLEKAKGESKHEMEWRTENYTLNDAEKWTTESLRDIFYVHANTNKMDHGGMMEHGGSVAKGNYEMLMSQAKEVMHHAEELMQVVKPNMDIEAWVVSKAERATTDLSDITHYLDGLKMAMGGMVKHNAHKVNG